MLTEIEKLDALGRKKNLVIYSIHQCHAGWGVQWFQYGWEEIETGTISKDGTWRQRLVVDNYYPTITEMIEKETERLNKL